MQFVDPASAKVPGPHACGGAVVAPQLWPAGQSRQPVAPASAYWPTPQATGAVAADAHSKPAGQRSHAVCSAAVAV